MAPIVFLFVLVAILASLDGPNSCDQYSPIHARRDHRPPARDAQSLASPGLGNSPKHSFENSVKAVTATGHQRIRLSSMFENGLLSILGMDSRPRRRTRETVIPKLMMDLYWERVQMAKGEGKSSNKSTNQTKTHHSHLHLASADIVRSFFSKDVVNGNITETDKESVLLFEVTDISTDERLRGAELIVHPCCSRKNDSTNCDSQKRFRLTVYQVLRASKPKKGTARRLLDTRTITGPRCGQSVSLDVSSAVAHWTHDQSSNMGLILGWTSLHEGTNWTERRGGVRPPVILGDSQANRPIVVSYSDSIRSPGTSGITDAERHKSANTGRHRKRSTGKRPKTNQRGHEQKNIQRYCQRRPMYIDFSDIGWDDWIVAPVGYMAHFCQGECPTFLHDYINYTNHAVIQSFVHSANPQAVTRPCCVATRLSAIPMLYVDSLAKVVLKNYEDMVVEACGCR